MLLRKYKGISQCDSSSCLLESHFKGKLKIINAGRDAGQLELLHIAGINAKWHNLFGKLVVFYQICTCNMTQHI